MKPRLAPRAEAGLTLFEVGVVVAVVLIVLAVLLPVRGPSRRTEKINCTNYLKQIGLAYRIWEGDNADKYPMFVSVTNGGSMESAQTGNVTLTFEVMSNELAATKILICPSDTNRLNAMSFGALANSNISYFIGIDVTNDLNPQAILSGDCNFELAGKPIKPGLVSFWTNDPVTWGPDRHVRSGNLGLADGSVQSTTSKSLARYWVDSGFATNRLAVP